MVSRKDADSVRSAPSYRNSRLEPCWYPSPHPMERGMKGEGFINRRRATKASSLHADFVKENPPLSGQRSIDQFGFVPIHPSVLKKKVSTVGFSAGLDMARNRNVR